MLASVIRSLADTSAFTHLHYPAVAEVLESLVERGLLATCGMVELEVLLTARNLSQLQEDRLYRSLTLIRIDIEEHDFARAQDVMEMLAAAGLHRAAKVNDLLIAAVAERAGLTVLHYDQDFEYIGQATGQAMEWVAPKGSL